MLAKSPGDTCHAYKAPEPIFSPVGCAVLCGPKVYSAASAGQQREDEAFKQRREQKSSGPINR